MIPSSAEFISELSNELTLLPGSQYLLSWKLHQTGIFLLSVAAKVLVV